MNKRTYRLLHPKLTFSTQSRKILHCILENYTLSHSIAALWRYCDQNLYVVYSHIKGIKGFCKLTLQQSHNP